MATLVTPPVATVQVRLAAGGLAHAKDMPLRIAAGHVDKTFKGTKPETIDAADWVQLQTYQVNGQPLLELAPAATPATKSAN